MEKAKKHNLKYWISEATSVGIALTTSALSAYLTDKVTDSNLVISSVSAIAGTIGWIGGTMGTYSLLHINDYISKERSFKQDMKNIFKSNIEGIATTYVVRIPLQVALQKYLKMQPPMAASISHIAGGIGGSAVRIIRNHQRNIFGNKAKKSQEERLEDLADFT